MRTTTMLTILVLALGLMAWSASVASGAQYLKVNGQDVTSITVELGQSRTVEVVSTDSTSYVGFVGFDNGVVRGTFSYLETKPEAGNLATVLDYNEPAFYGYYVSAAGISPAPSAGVHFVFEYVALQLGETDVKLYDSTLTSVIDSVHITVIPLQPVAMGTAFTYQGRLMDSNSTADGLYDFQFKLYDNPDLVFAAQQGSTIDVNDLDVIDGYFTVELDFGSDVFAGDARWLEVKVAHADGSDPCTLRPRVELTPVPYALHTRGVFVGQYNTFVGREAGFSNTTGYNNTFLGREAGYSNTTGNYNIFSGVAAGYSNTTGYRNTFVGNAAGHYNTTGYLNTFLGEYAGRSNTGGSLSTFLGRSAGYSNTTGYCNTFVGYAAGHSNTEGFSNTFLGWNAGYSNKIGAGNVFIGYQAGYNETGSDKLYIANSVADPPLIYGDFSTGNVGIGTTTPDAKLSVNGVIKASMLVGQHPQGPAVIGSADNPAPLLVNFGGIFSAAGQFGRGIVGTASNINPLPPGSPPEAWLGQYGGYFEAKAPAGCGVYGLASNTNPVQLGLIQCGGHFAAKAPAGRGVYGWASGTTGIGVYGRASASGDNVVNYGGSFHASGAKGRGVYGRAYNSGDYENYGGYFSAAGTLGRGVYGAATASSGTNYGVYGKTFSSEGYAGYFEGGKNYFEGNVGIGTTSPQSELHLYSNYDGSTILKIETDHMYGNVLLDLDRGDPHRRAAIRYLTQGSESWCTGMLYDDGIITDDYHIATGGGLANANYAKLTILTNGNVGIGTRSPEEKLEVIGTVRAGGIKVYDVQAHDVRVSNEVFVPNMIGVSIELPVVQWVDLPGDYRGVLRKFTSSARYKDNIQPADDDFHKILQVNPKSFTCKTTRQRGIGFIAEEFDQLGLSNLVIYDKDGRPDAIKYKVISVYLLEVIKDQVKSTEQLKAESESLKQKNQSLEQRLTALERAIQQLAKGKEYEL